MRKHRTPWLLLAMSACITMAAAGRTAAQVSVQGNIKYQGRSPASGGSFQNFNSRGVEVQIWEDLATDVLRQTVYTDDSGNYSGFVPEADANSSLYIKIFSRSKPGTTGGTPESQIDVVDYASATTDNGTYMWQSPAQMPDLGVSVTIDKVFNAATDLDYAFSVFDAAITQSRWNDTRDDTNANSVKIRFGGNPASSFSPANNWINLVNGDRYDWDVIGEEYNHYMQSQHGYGDSPGGSHSGRANMRWERDDLNFLDANRLAFSEGTAQFFGIAGQMQQNASALGIQLAGDTTFSDNSDADGTSAGSSYSLETRDNTFGSLGEDDEIAVQRILWDLFDSTNENADRDRVNLSLDTIYNHIQDNSLNTLNGFWSQLISGEDAATIVDYGAIFQAHNVSPVPDDTSIADHVIHHSAANPTFMWMNPHGKMSSNGGQTHDLLDKFGLKFFNEDFSLELLDVNVFGDTELHMLTSAQWDTLNDYRGIVNWVALGGTHNFDASIMTGLYWSDAYQFAIIPEPTGVLLTIVGGLGAVLYTSRSRMRRGGAAGYGQAARFNRRPD